MIPKIIHCIWLGHNPKSKMFQKCFESWQKFCPDYKIMTWDETNFDINKYNFCKEAYDSKKYAFASDFIRLFVLYNYGGIYLDTDMELISSIDEFLENKVYCGFEDEHFVSCGIIGAEKNNPHIKNILQQYLNRHFILENNNFDLTTIPYVFTKYLNSIGLINNGKTQLINNFKIYQCDYFYPISYNGIRKFSRNTKTIHHWSSSWKSNKDLRKIKIERIFNKCLLTRKFYSLCKRLFNI